MTAVTITNPTRTRKFGWGYNTSPSDGPCGFYFELPSAPDFTGTFASVIRQINKDATYQSLRSGGTYMSVGWFYDGKLIANSDQFRDQMNDIYQDREWAKEQRRPMPATPSIVIEVA